MKHVFHCRKLAFVEWNVEEVCGTLYGRIDCYITAELIKMRYPF